MTTAHTRRKAVLSVLAAGALVLAACGGSGDDSGAGDDGQDGPGAPGPDGGEDIAHAAAVSNTPEASAVLAGEGTERSVAAATTYFTSSPLVVLAPEAGPRAVQAASAAVHLGVPVIVDGDDAAEAAEIERLGAGVVLAVGPVSVPGGVDVDVLAPADADALAGLLGLTVATAEAEQVVADVLSADGLVTLAESAGESPTGGAGDGSPTGTESPTGGETSTDGTSVPDGPADTAGHDVITALPTIEHATPAAGGTFAVASGDPAELPAAATAAAAGAGVVVARGADPRATRAGVEAVHEAAGEAEGEIVVVGLSDAYGDAEQVAYRTRAAATGHQLPAGGQLVLPEHSGEQTGATYVALYGNPDAAVLGVLGEQGPEDTITRAQEVAAEYEPLTEHTVVPTLEIIATVASASSGDDGDYSNETPISRIRPLVDLAGEAGMYVVLDLQPGRTDFVTQARMYEELLLEPHVGLALDPEWRLGPDQVHMVQIGQVPVAEVNEVVTYLADLVREHDLPQKFLVLHQFQVRMIPDVDSVDQSRDEVRVLIHMDGQGSQGAKQATWRTLLANAPSVDAWGWKNFYDEDLPLLSPEGTMAVDPVPDLITYQ